MSTWLVLFLVAFGVLFALGFRAGPVVSASTSASLVYRITKHTEIRVGAAQPRTFRALAGTVLIAVATIGPENPDRVSDFVAFCGQGSGRQISIRADGRDAATCSNMTWGDVWPSIPGLQTATILFLVPDAGSFYLVYRMAARRS